MNRQPPSWIERLLRRFLDTRLLDAVLGDLYEKFQKRLAGKNSEWKASLLYCLEGIGFLRLARPAKRYPKASPLDLYRNYFTVALRYFQHEKAYSLLNFNGLFIGLTSAIILFIFVFNELSFDKFHKDYDRIYRLTTVFKLEEKETKYALNEGLWDDILIDEVVGVEHSTAFMPIQQELVMAVDNKSFLERKGFFSDPDFFKVFDFALLSGNRDNLLAEPNEMVVTRSFAERLFGTSDVLARPLTWRSLDGPIPLTVTGVVEDIPVNSSISFDFIISGSSMSWWKNQFSQSNRPGNTLHIYFKTAQHQEISDLQKTVDKAFSKKIKSTNAFSYETPVQPLANIYLNANNEFELIAGGNMNYIRIFFMIGIGILLITIVNSVNINTARSTKRAKEVGIRKALGTSKQVLITQFLAESILVTAAAAVMSTLFAILILKSFVAPVFSIDMGVLAQPMAWAIVTMTSLAIGVAAGLYPALKLASYKAASVLKGKLSEGRESLFGLRNVLVLVQIMTTASLLAFSIVIFRQVDYLNNKPLGYNKDNLVYFTRPDVVEADQWKQFQERLRGLAAVSNVGGCAFPLLGVSSMSRAQLESNKSEHPITAAWNAVDYDFVETMKMSMSEGRDFSRDFTNESRSIVINEAAREALGLQTVLGTKLIWWKGEFEIIGVVNDFHFKPFNAIITPTVFILTEEPAKYTYARINARGSREGVAQAEGLWKEMGIAAPMESRFFDETFNAMLVKEHQANRIITAFTFISLLITGIGLVGLIGYTAGQYRKEIGIRKVLGASMGSILHLIGHRLIGVVIIALVFSIPVIIPLADYWLKGFQYKIDLKPADFLLTGLLITLFVAGVVSKQLLSSALENPVDSIKEE